MREHEIGRAQQISANSSAPFQLTRTVDAAQILDRLGDLLIEFRSVVAVLIGAAVLIGLLLWMVRDAVRPFVLGLLLVYLLDPPVRWLARRGMRRSVAIIVVYVVAVLLFLEFLNLTLTPLIDEIVRLLRDLPALAQQLQETIAAEIFATNSEATTNPTTAHRTHTMRRGRGAVTAARPDTTRRMSTAPPS